jgi:hypothetical protein
MLAFVSVIFRILVSPDFQCAFSLIRIADVTVDVDWWCSLKQIDETGLDFSLMITEKASIAILEYRT